LNFPIPALAIALGLNVVRKPFSHPSGRGKKHPQALMIRTWGEKKARGEFWGLSNKIKTNFLSLSSSLKLYNPIFAVILD
jgi:hypothetical protein